MLNDTEETIGPNLTHKLRNCKLIRNKFLEPKRTPFEKEISREDTDDKTGSERMVDSDEIYRTSTRRKSKKKYDYFKDEFREELPAPKPKGTINVFKILKDAIGKDMSRF